MDSLDTPAEVGRRSLDAFFSDSVRRHPDRPALVAQGRSWSYRLLDVQCRSIESALSRAGLAGGGFNVGVVYAKGMFSYASIIAVMRSNNVYVPLNPTLPAERVLRILGDADIRTLIIDSSEALAEGVADALRRSGALQIVVNEGPALPSLDPVLNECAQHSVSRLSEAKREPTPEGVREPHGGVLRSSPQLAYIIFTSGSTGVPKGVPITHESAYRCIEKSHRLFGTVEEDRFTQFSALSFDVSILDLFLCWKSGAALHVPEPSEALVPMKFAVTHGVTVWSSVPSLSNFMHKLRLLRSNALPSVRLSLFCGEALPGELAQAWALAAPRSRIFNLYGPTECTIFATCFEYERERDLHHPIVPIGEALPGMSCRVIDEGLVVREDDVPGELWLAGDQLATGYWNNSTATRKAFVHSPDDTSAEGGIWYRTGDLVSYKSGVGLSFRGRLDRQLKLRGYRIELQEIESAVRDTVGCALVAVVPVRNSGGICERIVAFCDKLGADESTLKSRCLNRIPRYMVPDRILELTEFPLSANGKIDYLALAARVNAQPG